MNDTIRSPSVKFGDLGSLDGDSIVMGVYVESGVLTIHCGHFKLVPCITRQYPPLDHVVQQDIGEGLGVAGKGGKSSGRDLCKGSIGRSEDCVGTWKIDNANDSLLKLNSSNEPVRQTAFIIIIMALTEVRISTFLPNNVTC